MDTIDKLEPTKSYLRSTTHHPGVASPGATAGGLAGAIVGGVAAGPIGIVAGETLGGSIGGAIGRDTAQDTQSIDIESSRPHYQKVEHLLRTKFKERTYANQRPFEDFEQAYLHGVSCHDRYGYVMWDNEIEADMRQGWEHDPVSHSIPWDQARAAILDGWHAAELVGEEIQP